VKNGRIQSIFANQYVAVLLFGLASMFQNACANGFPATIYRYLEVRFNMNSVETGTLASCYELADVIFSLFLIHIFQKYHKPRVVACGLIFAGIGGIIFILPHYINEKYQLGPTGAGVLLPCPAGVDDLCATTSGSAIRKVTGCFYAGMLIIGAASVPMHAFVPVWIDENVKKENVGTFQAFWICMAIIGATVGAIGGGELAVIHVDFDRLPVMTPEELNPLAPVWVGAWWPGIFGASCALIVVCFFVAMIPRYLDNNHNQEAVRDQGEKNAPYWASTKELFSNPVWWLSTLCVACDSWVIQSMQAFGVRQMSLGFRLSLPMAAKWGGGLFLTGAVVGNVIIGIVMKKMGGDRLKISTLGKLALGGCCVGFLASFGFILRYSDTIIEGVDFTKLGNGFDNSGTNDLIASPERDCQRQGYSDNQWTNGGNITHNNWVMPVCGTRVNQSTATINGIVNNFGDCLSGTYFPVCDLENGKTYYSPCFGGCDVFKTVNGVISQNTKEAAVFPVKNSTSGDIVRFASCSCNKLPGHPISGEIPAGLPGAPGILSGIGETIVVPGHCSDNPAGIDKATWLAVHPHLDTNETWKFPVFWAITAVSIACFYFSFIPYMNIWIRGVSFENRAQSMAWSSIFVRVIGGIPGPILVGYMLDTTCVIWEKTVCGERGTCMVFSQNTAFVMLGIFLVTRALNILFCLVIIFISKKKEAEEERLQGETNKAVEE